MDMFNNPEETQNLVSKIIIALQKKLVEERKVVAIAIATEKRQRDLINTLIIETLKQNLIDQANLVETLKRNYIDQTRLVQILKQNLINLEKEISRFQAIYDGFNDEEDDPPPCGGIAPSPRPKTPPPGFDINDTSVVPDQ